MLWELSQSHQGFNIVTRHLVVVICWLVGFVLFVPDLNGFPN